MSLRVKPFSPPNARGGDNDSPPNYEMDQEHKINNFAIIQYELENGDMKVLAFSDYDIQRLKHRVSCHFPKKILSIQFYYNVTTNKDISLIKRGVILE